jgi:hypothetical protein
MQIYMYICIYIYICIYLYVCVCVCVDVGGCWWLGGGCIGSWVDGLIFINRCVCVGSYIYMYIYIYILIYHLTHKGRLYLPGTIILPSMFHVWSFSNKGKKSFVTLNPEIRVSGVLSKTNPVQ